MGTKQQKQTRPMPTDPKDLARAMFKDVEKKIEAKKKEAQRTNRT